MSRYDTSKLTHVDNSLNFNLLGPRFAPNSQNNVLTYAPLNASLSRIKETDNRLKLANNFKTGFHWCIMDHKQKSNIYRIGSCNRAPFVRKVPNILRVEKQIYSLSIKQVNSAAFCAR